MRATVPNRMGERCCDESEPCQSRLATRPPEKFGKSSPPLHMAYTTPSEEGLNKC